MKVTVKVDYAELDAALGNLGKASTAKGVLRRTGKQVLEPFDKAWRAGVNVATGQLQDSGGVGSNLTRSQRKANDRENFVEVFAGPGSNPQAIQEEFGNQHQRPNPAVRNAWEATSPAIPGAVGDLLWAEIEKTAARQAKRALKLAAKG